ncbi:hypothetical protein E4U42_005175 [Claviceps africana]|uniref:Transcription factor hoxa13 n=1 Tax=Claviceps africana TaxID=83212 RepID=A0A8K0NHJ4_9HYPO|nr:hypothetical protein E4U42_005175 [Claviceps africana]
MVVVNPKNGNGTSHTNGKLIGQAKHSRGRLKHNRGFWAWAVNLILRVATWGAILTILLRCPSSLEACDDTSPLLCKPYFRVKNAIKPHVKPYYAQYAAPYVNIAKPYYDTLNTNILRPTSQYAVVYGTPLVRKGQNFALVQWKSNGQPQLRRLQTLTKLQYDKSIAPHVTKLGAIVDPYYKFALKHASQACNNYVLPGYRLVRVYGASGYDVAADFTTTRALPATYWAWGKANTFFNTSIWPQLRVVYVKNVEPQLVRIGERLGRYRLGSNATSKAVSAEAPAEVPNPNPTAPISSSFSKPSPQSPSTTLSLPSAILEEKGAYFTDTAGKSTGGPYWNPVQAPPAAENESEKRRTAREMVANDLATWQNKFTSQAEEGAGAIEDQVDNIARTLMSNSAQLRGKALVQALEEIISSEVSNLKHGIKSIVEIGGSDAGDKAVSAIRAAGVAIKKAAQEVRGWREDYDDELQDKVLEAAEVHFQILDETRNLALQNIGMKWAWTDGVTYKDWQKYHELKNTLSDWTEELKQLIVTHPALLEAQELSHRIETDAMTMAANVARELARLRDVAHWKIQANDSSDNFESDAMRLAAEASQQSEKANIGCGGNEERRVEQSEEKIATDECLAGSRPLVFERPEDQSPAVTWSEAGCDGGDSETPEVLPTVNATITISLAKSQPSPHQPTVILDDDPDGSSSNSSCDNETDPRQESESGNETMATPAEDPQSSVKPVLFGAAAQSVADRSPILDDYTDSDDAVDSVISAAQAAYSSAAALAADRYSSALSVVSAQVQGTSKPVHEQLFSSVSDAYGGAVSAASQKLNEVVAAASSGVCGAGPSRTKSSNLPDWNEVESIAVQKLNEGRLWAEIQYQSVLIALGATTATPTATPERYYEQAKYHYYAGLGLAQDRYSSFMAAASSAWSAATATATTAPTPTDFVGSASSMASVAEKSAASAASAADGAAKSAYAAVSDGVMSAARDAQDTLEQAADAAAAQAVKVAGAVAGTWENAVSRISADVYGQPSSIGWFEEATQSASSVVAAATSAVGDSASSASDSAARQFEAVQEIMAELVLGKEETYSESVMSRLSAVYATATSGVGSLAKEASAAASSMGDKVVSAASQATEVVEESTQHVRDEL